MRDGETKQAGARLVVHDDDLLPLTEEYGLDLAPNTLTEAAVAQVNLVRQRDPYPSNCSDTWTDTNYTKFVPDHWPYSLQQCQRICSHSSILDQCGCFHPRFLDTESRFGYKPCNLSSTCKKSDYFAIFLHFSQSTCTLLPTLNLANLTNFA